MLADNVKPSITAKEVKTNKTGDINFLNLANCSIKSIECHFPLNWFLGSHCGDLKSASMLVWALLAILIGQAFVIMSMTVFQKITLMKLNEAKITHSEQIVVDNPSFNPREKGYDDCQTNVENDYSELVNKNENNGYMVMKAPENIYELPIHFKPSTKIEMVENLTAAASNPI